MKTVSQPSAAPTNKLAWATAVSMIATGVIKSTANHFLPWLDDQMIWAYLPDLIGFGVAYWFVQDKPNVAEPKEPVRGIGA